MSLTPPPACTHVQVLPLQISGGTITVSLPAACLAESALGAAGCSRAAFCGQRYGLTALLFNQGINSLQSLGFLLWGGAELLQDTINKCGGREEAALWLDHCQTVLEHRTRSSESGRLRTGDRWAWGTSLGSQHSQAFRLALPAPSGLFVHVKESNSVKVALSILNKETPLPSHNTSTMQAQPGAAERVCATRRARLGPGHPGAERALQPAGQPPAQGHGHVRAGKERGQGGRGVVQSRQACSSGQRERYQLEQPIRLGRRSVTCDLKPREWVPKGALRTKVQWQGFK